ncbi:MAG: carnitine dehydratase [Microbacterium sp. SCN 70-200]|uniref:CoA transferase n=1 Tax=unclassified Microbacterium TaxID=2609290 RepID=UPI0008685515|nr:MULTISPECIES: CoA transferase [unclassified Microbacterium]MBN9214105.1 CoA transferase [Microbacterium sp.]ODT39702.1 MAG: carnitine dehydratase [Microbacterium sp. SCN 70-200]OJV82779.1 MAG: carnitine dehydratase [Microbacterium sp. 70-16]
MTAAVALPARTDVAGLAAMAVGAATSAAMSVADIAGAPQLDPHRIAVAYSSERWMRIDGQPQRAFAPLSSFFATLDGSVRTHANYPHHRDRLLRGLGLPRDADATRVTETLAALPTASAVAAVDAVGGLCVPVRPEDPAADAALRCTPLVEITRISEAPRRPRPDPQASAPLRGVRVLDLTRVIAGPIATSTLALLGAEVLRLDPPALPEIAGQHLDTGHGKLSALLDLSTPAGAARFDELLASADIVALGYRPDALARLGLAPEQLAERRPGVIVLSLSAWAEPHRRGFDSLVQAASGIALIEGTSGAPGVLPAQALDHSAGYLLAAAAIDLVARRAREGGSWLARTSLRRVAAELLGLPRTAEPEPAPMVSDATGHTQSFEVDGISIVTTAPAIGYPGGPTGFAAPHAWGQDEPAWA